MDTENLSSLPQGTKRPHESDPESPSKEQHSIKRQNTADASPSVGQDAMMEMSDDESEQKSKMSLLDMHKESRFGICAFVHNQGNYAGFSGVMKTRSTDFIVRELDVNGEPLYLTDLEDTITPPPPKQDDRPVHVPTQGQHPAYMPSDRVTEFIAKLKLLFATVSEDESEFFQSLESVLSKLSDMEYLRTSTDPIVTITSKTGIAEKELRKKMHDLVREYLPRASCSSTTDQQDKRFTVSVGAHRFGSRHLRSVNPIQQFYNKDVWKIMGGNYISFSLYKENIDTHVVLDRLAQQLNIDVSDFQIAGTKDKRAVTIQNVTAYRVLPRRLMSVNHPKSAILTGNYRVCREPTKLGELSGNMFTIVVRQVSPIDGTADVDQDQFHASIKCAIESLKANGFINYYGMQRFGSSSIGTHEIGAALLAKNWPLAVSLILDPRDHDMPDYAAARHVWKSTRNAAHALSIFPHCAVAERAVLHHLSKSRFDNADVVFDPTTTKNTSLHCGLTTKDVDPTAAENTSLHRELTTLKYALTKIPSKLLSMYVSAFQSLVWNTAASARVQKFGMTPVVGDLVFGEPAAAPIFAVELACHETADESEVVVSSDLDTEAENLGAVSSTPEESPAGDSTSRTDEDYRPLASVTPLTQEMINSGVYKITDVLLPGPGLLVKYPEQDEIRKVYEECLAPHGLELNDKRFGSKFHPSLRLSGMYRHLIVIPGDVNYEILEDLDSKASMPQSFTDSDNDKLVLINSGKLTEPIRAVSKPRAEAESLQISQPELESNVIVAKLCEPTKDIDSVTVAKLGEPTKVDDSVHEALKCDKVLGEEEKSSIVPDSIVANGNMVLGSNSGPTPDVKEESASSQDETCVHDAMAASGGMESESNPGPTPDAKEESASSQDETDVYDAMAASGSMVSESNPGFTPDAKEQSTPSQDETDVPDVTSTSGGMVSESNPGPITDAEGENAPSQEATVIQRAEPVPGYALKITFSLPPAAYATMALREVMRTETASAAHAARTTRFQGLRPDRSSGRGVHRGGSFGGRGRGGRDFNNGGGRGGRGLNSRGRGGRGGGLGGGRGRGSGGGRGRGSGGGRGGPRGGGFSHNRGGRGAFNTGGGHA